MRAWIPNCEDLRNRDCIQYIVKEGGEHYCNNPGCIAIRFQKIKHFAKAMDIKGFGDSLLAKLMTGGLKVIREGNEYENTLVVK